MKLRTILTIASITMYQTSEAQINYLEWISGEAPSYTKVAVQERTQPPLVNRIERDMKSSKRIIRCIDVRQKMNKPMEWPRSSFAQHLMDELWEGGITAYRTDSMASVLNTLDYRSKLSYEVNSSYAPDPEDASYIIDTTYMEVMGSDDIKKFWIMEDWYFDAKHSVFKPVILGIAPIYKRQITSGITAQEQPLCWIKMDQRLRDMMSHWEYFNTYNDAARLNYDDLFQMRMFDSYIVFQSNVFDLYINQFQEYENDQVGALLKAEEIKNDLFVFEHDLWQF